MDYSIRKNEMFFFCLEIYNTRIHYSTMQTQNNWKQISKSPIKYVSTLSDANVLAMLKRRGQSNKKKKT